MKKNEELLDIIGEAKDEYVSAAAEQSKRQKIRLSRTFIGGGICAAAIIGVLALTLPQPDDGLPTETTSDASTGLTSVATDTVTTANTATDETTSPEVTEYRPIYVERPKEENTDLEKITLSGLTNGGMGFEGILTYDITTLYQGFPTTRADSLPVYKNLATIGGVPKGIGLTAELTLSEMERMAENIAYALDTEIIEMSHEICGEMLRGGPDIDTAKLDLPLSLDAKCDGIRIHINGNGDISIFFDENVPLPEDNKMEYIIEKYNSLMQYKNPQTITITDSDFDGREHAVYYVFDNSGDDTEKFVNANLCNSRFGFDSDGLFVIHLSNPLVTSEYLGNYPIITETTAKNYLLQGMYLTTVPEEYIDEDGITEEKIGLCRLCYRSGCEEDYFLPYYQFYVKLDEALVNDKVEGLNNYGVYYIPAVSPEYLTGLTLWDERFN